MNKTSMGQLIAAKRKELGLTQQELADRMGVTDKAVSKWERDLSCPDVSTLPHLAGELGLTPDELLGASTAQKAATSPAAMVTLVMKAVALALGVAVTVLTVLGELETESALIMLGLGLACAGAALLDKK
ncbi:MAG: helix-turn-helix transcriptional regulator [Firmicutes bacterium]|nr:helix-turn-helix transcriptional regulator [Bacillota bacterium]